MKKNILIILTAILLISLLFRTYQIIERYNFGHDGELFSWIVKDIVVNHHPRLIGQLTSAPGIFVGPLFYYLLVPFFFLTKMDPIGALMPITILGVLTTLSYYIVFSKLFSRTAGLITAFLHSTLLTWVNFDRQVFPSTLTNLWIVWYFYTIIQIGRGNFNILPLLGILIGLIWNIHIALIPTLFAIPVAFFLSQKKPKLKAILYFFITFTLTSSPLILFEIKHGFSQTRNIIENFTTNHGGGTGLTKLIYVAGMASKNINNLIFYPYSLPEYLKPILPLVILSLSILLIKKKILKFNEVIIFSSLLIGVIGFFSLSSSLVSEYYLYSIEIVFISLIALSLGLLFKNKYLTYLLFLVFIGILINNLYVFSTEYIYKKGYLERKNVVEFITSDLKSKGFPCIGVSYITTPGENTGFRYFFYLKKQHLVHPSTDVPVYNIVIPDELSLGEVKQKFGHIGIIPPTKLPSKEIIDKTCQGPNTNLTDSVFGYVD